MTEELWMEFSDIVKEAGIKTIPKKQKLVSTRTQEKGGVTP